MVPMVCVAFQRTAVSVMVMILVLVTMMVVGAIGVEAVDVGMRSLATLLIQNAAPVAWTSMRILFMLVTVTAEMALLMAIVTSWKRASCWRRQVVIQGLIKYGACHDANLFCRCALPRPVRHENLFPRIRSAVSTITRTVRRLTMTILTFNPTNAFTLLKDYLFPNLRI
jgi:hypothetical protein